MIELMLVVGVVGLAFTGRLLFDAGRAYQRARMWSPSKAMLVDLGFQRQLVLDPKVGRQLFVSNPDSDSDYFHQIVRKRVRHHDDLVAAMAMAVSAVTS